MRGVSAPLLADIARLSRERDELDDQLKRQRQRYLYGLDAALAILRERPELEHTTHRAA